jgi:uncharacterized protein YjbI with pentapeptide repeats
VRADFTGTKGPGSAFNESVLRQANLSKTVFTDSDFQAANLLEADMTGADFTHVRLEHANLRKTKQDGTIFTGSLMPDGTTAPYNESAAPSERRHQTQAAKPQRYAAQAAAFGSS